MFFSKTECHAVFCDSSTLGSTLKKLYVELNVVQGQHLTRYSCQLDI